jgi:hypothetical protein
MKLKLSHPLWTHLPSVTALVIFIIYLITSDTLPNRAPIHFNFSGEPNGYGSPWLAFGLTIGLSVFFILLSIFLDTLWAKQEKTKTFNWLSLLDEIVVGALVGVNLGYLAFLNDKGTTTFDFPWIYLLAFGGGAAALAVILEKIRPFHPYMGKAIVPPDNTFKDSLTHYLKGNSPFVYWDYQNPFYISLLTLVLPLILLIAAVLTWFSEPWASLLLGVVGILLIIPHGGQRTIVTRSDVTVHWGILGFKVLRLKNADFALVEIHEFSPLKDFGGYGIRFNREMKAYFLRGTKGVKLTTNEGKKYLIGSDNADRLIAVINAVSLASGKERG